MTLILLYALWVEIGPDTGPVTFKRPRLADRIGALENPILPSGQAAEDAGFHGFGANETQIGLQARQRVGRERGALFKDQAHLVIPVNVVIGKCYKTVLFRAVGIERLTDQPRSDIQ